MLIKKFKKKTIMEHSLPTNVIQALDRLSPELLKFLYQTSLEDLKKTVIETTVNSTEINITGKNIVEYYKQYPEKFL